jgi:hypothetical protein
MATVVIHGMIHQYTAATGKKTNRKTLKQGDLDAHKKQP